MEVDIRSIRDDELEQLVPIWNSFHEQITTSKLIVNHDGLKDYRASNNVLDYIGAFEDGNLVGFVSLGKEENQYFLNQIGVHELYHRKGVGRQLIDHCKQMTMDSDFDQLNLYVMVINIRALKFFLNNDFDIHSYEVEEEYKPKDFSGTHEEYARLVEYKLIWRAT